MFNNREIVSFDGKCEMNCKHCFALEQECEFRPNDVGAVIESLRGKKFDIIYVSHNKENFSNAEIGLELCEKLYDIYDKDLCITSRCILNDETLRKMILLNKRMKKNGKRIYWCESVPALESASITEDLTRIPSPEERIDFLGKLKESEICSILSVRPLFPNVVISNNEIKRLIEMACSKIDAVITGGLITTKEIDRRLGIEQKGWRYLVGNDSEYLVGAIGDEARFVDVREEMLHLKQCCDLYGVKFFEHSMQAINYLANKYSV